MYTDPLYVIHVDNIDKAWQFYVYIVGCTLIKATDTELDLAFYGSRVSVRLGTPGTSIVSEDTGEDICLGVSDWCALSERLRERKITFDIETGRRFSTDPGKQCSINFIDPAGNTVQVKGFANDNDVLAA
jgi:extradiol dioxygenase family protein